MDFKHYLKMNFKVLLSHITAQLIALAIWLLAFVYITSKDWGKVLVCVFLSCFYAVWMYSCAYKIGERDTKSYSEHKPYHLKGFTLCAATVVFGLIFALLYKAGIALEHTNRVAYVVLTDLYSVWNFNLSVFVFFPHNMGILFYVLSFLITIVSVVLGYLAGMYRFEAGYKILTKLVYKSEKKK